MPNKEKKLFRRFFSSRWFLVAALGLAILVAVGYARAYYQDYKIRQKIKSLQDQVDQLGHKKLESMELLKYVTSEAFVEEKARSEFNFKKPGENVLIVKSNVETVNNQDSLAVEKKLLNNPAKWWYYFIYKSLPKD